jgi:hypothetical protein
MKKLLLVLLGVMSLGAWGQDAGYQLTSTGCKYFINNHIVKQLKGEQEWKGACVNGYLEGPGVFLTRFSGSEQMITKGYWQQGKGTGVHVSFYRNYDPPVTISVYRNRGDASTRTGMRTTRELEGAVVDAFNRIADVNTTVSQGELMETVREWAGLRRGTQPAALFAKLTTPVEQSTASASAKQVNDSPRSNRSPLGTESSLSRLDDPKVFGRSAVSNEEELRKTEELRQANEQREANLRRNQENQARIAREKEEREARELKELTDTLQQLSNSLGNLRRR